MTQRVIILGGGLAGVVTARVLREAGVDRVRLVERSAVLGGRMGTRRVEGEQLDEGAAFLVARDPGFRRALDPLVARGVLRPWAERLHRATPDGLRADALTASERRLASPGGMASVVEALAEGLDIERGRRAVGLAAAGDRWTVRFEDGGVEQADVVVCAMPAPEGLALARTTEGAVDHAVLAELGRVELDPCIVLLAGLESPAPSWRAVQADDGDVRWMAIDSTKRDGPPTLVVHASPDWSRARLDAADEAITTALLETAGRLGRFVPRVRWTQVKRWESARPKLLATARALVSREAGPPLVFCGDWCVAPRVEGAFLSGVAAAERLLFERFV